MNLWRAGLAASALVLAACGGATSPAGSPSSANSTISAAESPSSANSAISAASTISAASVLKAVLPAAKASASPNGTTIGSTNITDTYLVAASSGYCATVNGFSTTAGATIVQWPCGVPEQNWSLAPIGNYYHIVSAGSGLCMNVSNGSTAEGDPIIQWPCQTNGATTDQWSIVAVAGYYEIVSAYDGQCLNVDGGSQALGAALIQSPCISSANNDLWNLAEPSKQVQIVDSSGNVWTVFSGVVYENGAEAGDTTNVTLLLYDNNSLYQENSTGKWYSWNGSGWISSSDPRANPSPNGTTVPTATQITDGSRKVWAIASGVAYVNGVATDSANVTLLLYDDNSLYGENSAGSWYSWNGSGWMSSSDPRAKPSTNGTTEPNATQITDSSHNVWTFVGGVVYENGALAGVSKNVTELLYYSGLIYQEDSTGKWYSWNGSRWIASSDPESGDATLSWDAPTENTNGTPLKDLAGYTIFYGSSPAELTNSIEVADPRTTKYVVSNLTAGTYYFAVAADASDGKQSKKSPVGSKTIP